MKLQPAIHSAPKIMIEMSTRASAIEIVPEKPSINLLGPFRLLIRLTGLDCSIVARYREGCSPKLGSFLAHIMALIMIAAMIFRTVMFLKLQDRALSIGWAETYSFGFMSFHSIVCAFCIFVWTRNSFIPNHAYTLERLRTLRVAENQKMDSYSVLHLKCAIFAILFLLAVMCPVIYCAIHKKLTYSSAQTAIYIYIIMAVLAFLSWLIVSCCLIMYGIVQVSMEREIAYFNQELQKASDEGALCHFTVFSAFSRRQIELIKMVEQANLSLRSYITFAPFLYFIAIICSVFITGFFHDLPILYFVFLLFGLNSALGISIISLQTAGTVQDALTATSKVLLQNEKLEKINDVQVSQIYRNMLDRSLKTDTRLYVMSGIPINSATANTAIFLFPSLGAVLQLVKQIIDANAGSH